MMSREIKTVRSHWEIKVSIVSLKGKITSKIGKFHDVQKSPTLSRSEVGETMLVTGGINFV